VITISGTPATPEPESEEEGGIRPLSDRLMAELTAHRTLALREAVGNNPQVALTALLHKLVSDTFRYRSGQSCLDASVREVQFGLHGGELNDNASGRAVGERHAAWGQEMPQDDEALWDWLAGLDEASRMALLAHCVSFGVNALYEKPDPYGSHVVSEHGLRQRLAQANRLARATGLDMVAAGWKPTVGNYFGRVTKTRILEAVREGAGERAGQLIAHLKKGEMAREAERLLAETGWLPEPLRLITRDGEAGGSDGPVPDMDVLEEADALPAFLAVDVDTREDDPLGEARSIAAE
jgi:ParB family chromosome partitioning protein